MASRAHDLQVYGLSREVAREVWSEVLNWDHFAKSTVGNQWVRATDSIGANIAEGVGRPTDLDGGRFFGIALGSTRESMHWAEVAQERGLIVINSSKSILERLDRIARMLASLIQTRRTPKGVAEEVTAYDASQEFPRAQSLEP